MPTATPSRQLVATPSHEGSQFRPTKDSDDVRQQWKRNEVLRKIIGGQNDSINQITRTVEKLRRRILGGSGSASGGGFVEEYDETKTYQEGEIVKITTSRVISGITLLPGVYAVNKKETDRNAVVWAGAVTYSAGNTNTLPQYPIPAGTVFWNPLVVYCGGY